MCLFCRGPGEGRLTSLRSLGWAQGQDWLISRCSSCISSGQHPSQDPGGKEEESLGMKKAEAEHLPSPAWWLLRLAGAGNQLEPQLSGLSAPTP